MQASIRIGPVYKTGLIRLSIPVLNCLSLSIISYFKGFYRSFSVALPPLTQFIVGHYYRPILYRSRHSLSGYCPEMKN